MNIIKSIKSDKADIEKHRTIAKIHLSWNAKRRLLQDAPMEDFDPKSSNLSDTLLGYQLVVHTEQVEDYWFEDVNGQKIPGSGSSLTRIS